eukprot:121162_1
MAYYNRYQSTKWPVSLCNDRSCGIGAHGSEEVLGKGSGKTVYYGRYCRLRSNRQTGQKCVIKFYNEKYVFDEDFWSREIHAHERALELATEWNKHSFSDLHIDVLVPQQSQLVKASDSHSRRVGEYCLVENYLPVFQKFNSNTMTCSGYEQLCIQAFSHWTYHHSNGEYMFVDCQGMKDSSGYTLTDPVIISKSFWTSSYGPCDGGKDMMITWFQNHRCNSYCGRRWKRATGRKSSYIKPTQRTTYVWQTQQYKNEASQGYCLGAIQEY